MPPKAPEQPTELATLEQAMAHLLSIVAQRKYLVMQGATHARQQKKQQKAEIEATVAVLAACGKPADKKAAQAILLAGDQYRTLRCKYLHLAHQISHLPR